MQSPHISTKENAESSPTNRASVGSDDEKIDQGEDPIRGSCGINGACCGKDPACRSEWPYRRSGICSCHAIRRDIVPPGEGREREVQRHRKNPGNILFTASYSVKKNLRQRPFHRAKYRLQSNLPKGYNPRTIPRVCVQYAIGGGSRYRVVSVRTEPP